MRSNMPPRADRQGRPLQRDMAFGRSISRRRFTYEVLAAMGAGAIASATGAFAGDVAAAEKLNFQAAWLNDPEFIGYMIAIDKGYYAARGLSMTYMPGGPAIVPEAALLSSKADISLTKLTGTVNYSNEGANLRIVGAQYQKSPLGVISLEEKNIKEPKDLVGKTVACSSLDLPAFQALLKIAGIPSDQVRLAPITFDPKPLVRGDIDAIVEFVTELPFLIERDGHKKTSYFLLWDFGLPLFIDLVTVRLDTLKTKRGQIIRFLRASREGWRENNADPTKYPARYVNTWFKGNGMSLAEENFYNQAQISLMASPKGIFTIDAAAVDASLEALAYLGVRGSKEIFDLTLLAEL
jgi:ABC-type nitrate/sulfonate/bicarbonate transport system substrate-binding protein